MDREIEPAYKKKRILKRFAIAAIPVLCITMLVGLTLSWIRPSVRRSLIRTARVDIGTVESGISASGIVVPEQNQVLSSPIDARVVRVLKRPGDYLEPGDSILELDAGDLYLSLDKVRQNLALKRNQQERTILDLENTLIDLESRRQIKELELQLIQTRAAQNRKLFENGLLPESDIKQVEMEIARTRIELKQLSESKRNAESSSKIVEDGLAMETVLLEKEEKAILKDLELTEARTDRRGVLTWVVSEEGKTIRKGEEIARLADLDSFRVEAQISDIYANRISVGLPVRVVINDNVSMPGMISQVLPAIENGAVSFHVALEDKSYKGLRSNLRVDVDIVTDRRMNALRIKKGPAILGVSTREVFVVRGSRAVKTAVSLGMVGLLHYEVERGLMEGDEVILSDMEEYMDLKEIALKE
jgi:HlyD family secretion protein